LFDIPTDTIRLVAKKCAFGPDFARLHRELAWCLALAGVNLGLTLAALLLV
jgi:hypothetical protein